jgi:IS5 family transposase
MHWTPSHVLTEREERLLQFAGKSRKLLVFLCRRRLELFDGPFQDELASMYRDTGQGQEPSPPARLAMALLLQGYLQVSDKEAVVLSATDKRWRLVLGLALDEDVPAFSQGALQQFRERLIRFDLDGRLLARTVELAKSTREFDFKKLPKTLRLAVDSRPFEGAGRVEDTFNLLGHAGKKILHSVATFFGTDASEIGEQARTRLLLGDSVKAELDIDWNDPEQKREALNDLCQELDRLCAWVGRHVPAEVVEATPLSRYLEALTQVKAQDVEPASDGGVQLVQGVAPDRRVSIEDADMRHGRKSKSKRFNGYKQHLATDLDSELIPAVAVTPANRPEEEAMPLLQEELAAQGYQPDELHIDRAFVNSTLAEEVEQRGGEVVAKPWRGANVQPGLFGKKDFEIDVRNATVTCPAGQVEAFEPGQTVEFDPEACGVCPLRAQCTKAASGRGRTVTMGDNEALQRRLRGQQRTRPGRARLRQRVGVEHRLAHLANRQGPKARYRGLRKNTYDLRRMAAIQNLEVIHRRVEGYHRRAP